MSQHKIMSHWPYGGCMVAWFFLWFVISGGGGGKGRSKGVSLKISVCTDF